MRFCFKNHSLSHMAVPNVMDLNVLMMILVPLDTFSIPRKGYTLPRKDPNGSNMAGEESQL